MLYRVELGADIRQSWELMQDGEGRMVLLVRERHITPRISELIDHFQTTDVADSASDQRPAGPGATLPSAIPLPQQRSSGSSKSLGNAVLSTP